MPPDLADTARCAAAGDAEAWHDLVRQLTPMLRRVVRGYRLGPQDAEDVVQTVWLRALEHVDRLKNPAAIAAWLTVTARRESMRTLQRGVRELLCDEFPGEPGPASPGPDAMAISSERRVAVRRAVDRLPGRQRDLLGSLLVEPSRSYQEIASTLGMPVGSIGPTRERAFVRLREDAQLGAALVS